MRSLWVPEGKEHILVADEAQLVAVLPEAKAIVTAGSHLVRGKPWIIRLRDAKTGKIVAQTEGAPLEIGAGKTRVAVSPDGKQIALACVDPAKVRVWRPDTGKTISLHHGHAELSGIGLSPDGKTIATAGPRNRPSRRLGFTSSKGPQLVKLWNLTTKRTIASAEVVDVRISWLTFSPDGSQLLVAGSEDVLGDGPDAGSP